MNKVNIFQTTPRILIGAGVSNQIADEVKRLSGKSVMIITDPGLVKSGICDRIEAALVKGGCFFSAF